MNRVNLSKSKGGGKRLESGMRSSSGNLASSQHASIMHATSPLLRNLAVELVDLDGERVGLWIWASCSSDSILADGSELQSSDIGTLFLIAVVTYTLRGCIGDTSKNLQKCERPFFACNLSKLFLCPAPRCGKYSQRW